MRDDWTYALGLIAFAALEYWLGRTRVTRAGSVVELVILILQTIWRRDVSITQVQVRRAKELGEVLDLVAKLVDDIALGASLEKIQADVLPKLMTAISGAEQIPQEFQDDPIACEKTVADFSVDLLNSFKTGWERRAALPPVKP